MNLTNAGTLQLGSTAREILYYTGKLFNLSMEIR